MSKPISKSDLVAAIAEALGSDKKSATAALDAVCDTVSKTVAAGDAVMLPNIGKLSVRDRAARQVRSPATGAVIDKPADKVVKFTVAKHLKDTVNGA